MRLALVSPYSYAYPGGVGRHVEELADELLHQGHEVKLFTPCDPDDRLTRLFHRGARPHPRPLPDHVVPLGRTVGLPMNGAVSNLSFSPAAIAVLGHELRNGGYDVVHVHEPNAPCVSWYAVEAARAPVVATFHAYSTSRFPNYFAANIAGVRRLYAKLAARIVVSEAARWTAERFYGGRYRVIPNGVDTGSARPSEPDGHSELRLLFVGRPEERKGLPVLLRAFEALRGAGVDARLTVAGAAREEVEPLLLDSEAVEIAGRVSDDEKWRLLGSSDVLVAPSLGGESFGMVLTEAFASGTPVVASDIAGYRDVVRHGRDGLLVPAGQPVDLGEALAGLALDADRLARMAAAARDRSERFAWTRVASEVVDVYQEARSLPEPQGRVARLAVRTGVRTAHPGERVAPRRLASIEPRNPVTARSRRVRAGRRLLAGAGAVVAAALAVLAFQRIGLHSVGRALLAAAPVWMLVSFGLMCSAMLLRAEAWHAILRAALGRGVRVRRRDAARGTMIGVLMSATLPARLGEPSRALVVARRLGRMRDRFPLVLGTLVSQTLLNLVALSVLGAVMFSTVGLFRGHEGALVVATIVPVVLLVLVLSAPWLLHRGRPSRFQRAQQAAVVLREAMLQVRSGLSVFRHPRLGGWAALTQLSAWALQWVACYALLAAFGLDQRAGMGAAAAVLFAVNVTAALPATPSNLGVFQAACIAVLSAYGVGKTDALAYGIILQAVEIATAVTLGMPALVREGMSWKDLRLRAFHAAPVELGASARRREAAEA